MPYPYTYFNPSKKEQAAITIGSLLAGGLGATLGESPGDAIAKGIAGAAGGYGTGYDYYQKLMNDAFSRDLQNKRYDQYLKEYEEVEKPYRKTMQNYYDSLSNYRESPRLPADVQTWLFGQNIQSPRQRSEYYNRTMPMKSSPITNVSVSTGGDAEKEEQKVIGKTFGESYQNLQKDAASAQGDIDMFGTMKELMSQTQTGALEPMKTKIAGYAQSFGIPVDPKWNANQMIDAISNKMTIMARKVGEGQMLAGQISDADREFLKQSVPNLRNLPGANQMLIDWNIKLAQRKMQLAELAEQYYTQNKTMIGFNEFKNQWVKQNPLFSNNIGQQSGGTHTMPDGSTMKNTEMQPQKDPFAKYWK